MIPFIEEFADALLIILFDGVLNLRAYHIAFFMVFIPTKARLADAIAVLVDPGCILREEASLHAHLSKLIPMKVRQANAFIPCSWHE